MGQTALSVEQIQAAITADVAAQPNLTYVDPNNNILNITTNTSKRAKWNLWTFIVAAAISLNEQLTDMNMNANEAAIAAAIPETPAWVAAQVFNFQYSADTPQIIQLVNLLPVYPIFNAALQIISRCSVTTTSNNQVLIKVATGNPPAALTTDQISALQDMINTIGVPGVNYVVSSGNADQLFIQANIYYAGQYSSVISVNVIAAINTFLVNLSSAANFNGVLKISDLENVIRNVPGVNDVVLTNVKARQDSTALADTGYLVQAQTLTSRLWPTVAGYIIGETTVGNTFADTLIFIPQ